MVDEWYTPLTGKVYLHLLCSYTSINISYLFNIIIIIVRYGTSVESSGWCLLKGGQPSLIKLFHLFEGINTFSGALC